MKIQARLDHSTILANQGRPVHLALELVAPPTEASSRRPMAFCAVLDRSGSMRGEPLAKAKAACESIIRNLRSNDQFALVIFDDRAEVVLPMGSVTRKSAAIQSVRRIQDRGSTNLTAGWMLGRDELRKTPDSTTRRTLLLSDGLLNAGITAPDEVTRVVSDGLERSRIRTATLGFGDGYDENLLERLATCSGGNFYDANSAEKLPAIFEAELEGLQRTASQNVRVRVRKLDFCENWVLFASYHSVALPDGRIEISLGDLTSEESATLVFHLDVLPLPILSGGEPVATLEGERLVELEVLWDDLSTPDLASRTHTQTIRILSTPDPADIRVDEDVIPAVATQCAGLAVEKATEAANKYDTDQAIHILQEALAKLESLGNASKAGDGIEAIRYLLSIIENYGTLDARASKSAKFRSSHMRKMKSMAAWTLDEQAPSYSAKTITPQQNSSDNSKS
ncbi:MAG: vWA domain-containing protein [Spartobacteria bacterium]